MEICGVGAAQCRGRAFKAKTAARSMRLKFPHCCKVFATRKNFPANL